MTPNASLQASSSPNSTATRSLFSRLSSPLRSRARNLVDFHIRPHDPHRQYSPGDIVKGLAVLTVAKPIRITHLTVALHGLVRVYKGPNGVADSSADPGLLPPGSARKTQYLGNGQASLFQDEQILCGEGRLESGIYEFEFELEFPNRQLPTSLDFERGSISYVIRATITRPTSIAATSSCDRKISLVESVDIGLLVPPRPCVISLEPISRRSRRSAKARAKSEKDVPDGQPILVTSRRTDSPAPEESASQNGSSEPVTHTRSHQNSDSHSEVSGESVVSSSTGRSFTLGSAPPSTNSARGSQTLSDQSISSKTITATIELLKGGCLPGDSVALRVSIQHTKPIRSMHGIIITLYRQGRIDYAPPLSPFLDPTEKAAKQLKHEEYYPKSKTGLGGLSLTSAGSSSVFRKDLAQTFAPIIINPATMSTVVTASIRVPGDVFPTIKGVPGQMIEFKYHIEVVVDLGGKLAGQDRHVPRMGMMKTTLVNNGSPTIGRDDGSGNLLTTWGGSAVETDNIRREKSVVACAFEIIVGTTDSARLRGRGNNLSKTHSNAQSFETALPTPTSPSFERSEDERQGEYEVDGDGGNPQHHNNHQNPPVQLRSTETDGYNHAHWPLQGQTPASNIQQAQELYVPPPEIVADENLSEKDRLRRAEQRLLPSQPPDAEAGPSSRALSPSAPAYLEIDVPAYDHDSHEGGYLASDIAPPRSLDDAGNVSTAPVAPMLEDLTPTATGRQEDDKQELERRRLLVEASSPPNLPNEDNIEGDGSNEVEHAPTAPVFCEEDIYEPQYSHRMDLGIEEAQDALPGYQC
ncbi:MAG: ph-response sensor protein [Claussenomyces sp. TS43310]|nr:MAG: ph-response sensor protein [Claussenomyces sp. TS43310]